MNELIEDAVRIAKKLIKPQEGYSGVAYPDPASPYYKALSAAGLLKAYLAGNTKRPKGMEKLDGKPWTIGYGDTEGVQEGDVTTPEAAEAHLDAKVRTRILQVIDACPLLAKHSAEKIAACVSLQYNIGASAFANSTLVRKLNVDDMQGAADQFLVWNKAQGAVMQGLVNRRKTERDLFLSQRN